MAAVNFTPAAAARIIIATKRVERTRTSLEGERTPSAPQEISFWAWLSSGGGLNGLFWSWIKVQPVAELPTADDPWSMDDVPLFDLAEPHVTGYQNAREVSNNRNVPQESIVLLTFIGYDKTGGPQYAFQFHGQQGQGHGLPIHSHRDNLDGGFAWAVYAPGTALPQQPFHL